MSQGSASSTAAIISTLSGTKNGENTPMAMSFASCGMWALIGMAIRSISPPGPGQMASRMPATTSP